MKFKILMILTSILFTSASFADVVFLDFNFNPLEVEAARKAAEARGEKFHTFPVFEKSDLERIKHLTKRNKYFHRAWLKDYDAGKTWDEPQESFDVKRELDRFKYKYMIDKYSVSEFLKENVSEGEVSSLVISGHSEGTSYFGSMGEVDFDDLNDILVDQKLKDNLKSVYLWGCFTGTPGAMLMWRENFPFLNAVAGFEGRSPLGDMKNSYELLEKLMVKEGHISNQMQMKDLSREVRAINYEYITGLTYMQGGCFVSGLRKKETRYVWEIPEDCKGKVTMLLTMQKNLYIPFARGDKELPNPDDGTTELRRFYDTLQGSFHCLDHCKSAKQKEEMGEAFATDQDAHNYSEKKLPCPGEVIRLIKFEHIANNFKVYHQEALDLLNNIAVNHNISSCANLFNESGADALNIFANNKQRSSRCISDMRGSEVLKTIPEQELKKLQRMLTHSARLTGNLTSCVPFSWIEDQITPATPSSCL